MEKIPLVKEFIERIDVNALLSYYSSNTYSMDLSGKIVWCDPQQAKISGLNEVLELIYSLLPVHLYWKDCNGVYLGCNALQAKTLKLAKREDIVGKTDFDLPWGIQGPEQFAAVDQQVIATRKIHVAEERVLSIENKETIYLSIKSPLIDKDTGEVLGVVGISLDITDKKNIEKLNAQLESEKERNKVIKLLAGSISHELRTPLSTIYLGLQNILESANNLHKHIPENNISEASADDIQQLKSYAQDLQDLPQDLIHVISNCQKVINMQLKNIAIDEVTAQAANPCQIKKIIEEAVSLYPYSGGQKDLIHTDFSKCNDFSFLGNPKQMLHVFWNLMKNALYYIEAAGKGEIFISLSSTDEFNVCVFKDTGAGMAADVAENVFKAFFTRRINGTGLGLSFCDLVMKSCGGKILCRAEEGEFTEFSLLFPKQ